MDRLKIAGLMASGRCFRVNWAEGKAMKNRLWKIMALLGFLVVGGSGRGEVVFSNNAASNTQSATGNTSSTTAYTLRTNAGVNQNFAAVVFTAGGGAGQLWNLSEATIRFKSNRGSTALTLEFELYNYNTSTQTLGSSIGAFTNTSTYPGGNSGNDVSFNIASSFAGLNIASGSSYLLAFGPTNSGFPSGSDLDLVTPGTTWTGGWSFTTGTVNTNSTTVAPTTFTSGTNYAVALSANAVPEPGSLLLGTVAISTGGAGVWWKRRKKNTTKQPQASEEIQAV